MGRSYIQSLWVTTVNHMPLVLVGGRELLDFSLCEALQITDNSKKRRCARAACGACGVTMCPIILRRVKLSALRDGEGHSGRSLPVGCLVAVYRPRVGVCIGDESDFLC